MSAPRLASATYGRGCGGVRPARATARPAPPAVRHKSICAARRRADSPPMSQTHIVVNGKKSAVEAHPDTPLLWVLRDTLGLTGTKFGCGIGVCGACTVHVDGEAVRSCTASVSETAGKRVTTVEG